MRSTDTRLAAHRRYVPYAAFGMSVKAASGRIAVSAQVSDVPFAARPPGFLNGARCGGSSSPLMPDRPLSMSPFFTPLVFGEEGSGSRAHLSFSSGWNHIGPCQEARFYILLP